MKKQALLCFVLLSVGFLVAAAQTQPVKITVTNTKGKPLNKALISLKSAPHYRTPGKDGSLTVQALPNDTIFVTLDRYIGSIPVDASSEVAVAVAKGQMFKAENGKPTSTAYTVLTLPPFNQYDLTTMPNLHAYPDLKSFVTVRYPAVRIKDGEAYLLSSSAGRPSSGTLATGEQQSSPPMLIVVDGSPRQNFGTVNDVVRPSELKSLVIKKADAMYGMRGAGGIIEITLKKGGE